MCLPYEEWRHQCKNLLIRSDYRMNRTEMYSVHHLGFHQIQDGESEYKRPHSSGSGNSTTTFITHSHIMHNATVGFRTDSVVQHFASFALYVKRLSSSHHITEKQQLATTTWKKLVRSSDTVSHGVAWCGVFFEATAIWRLFYWEQSLCLLNWVGNTENRPTHSVCTLIYTVMVKRAIFMIFYFVFFFFHTKVLNSE